ncbi:MAG: hypothetical protein ACI30B_03675 [Paludibacteraceae bacterium]
MATRQFVDKVDKVKVPVAQEPIHRDTIKKKRGFRVDGPDGMGTWSKEKMKSVLE